MKTILLILFVLPVAVFAQLEANNFKVTEEGRVIWQKVFENSDVSFDDLINTVNANRKFSDIQVSDNKITFLGTGIETDPKASGFSRGSTSFYALGKIECFFTIDYKDNRYRITAINITSEVPVLNILNASQSKYEQTPIESSVGNGKGLKKGFIKKESKIMNDALEAQFQIMKATITDDNW